ncbi:DUF2281 domain-containing protein [Salicibibacter cibi]|uniref:DUF2281 domain-containing protein n=1 Tax=Salicibibacter cibi TaxID=2743001 RepID=UPI0019033F1A|nr:DUF2281 domain-containing protein [Salicibibacter cibi]
MNPNKERIIELIEDISEKDMAEIIDFIGYLKMKREKEEYQDVLQASESSIDFWDNKVDDEVWNDALAGRDCAHSGPFHRFVLQKKKTRIGFV